MQSKQSVCQNCKTGFTIEPDDFNFYKKIGFPAPTFCPQCRFIRRLSWRNERSLYRRDCALCRKPTLTVFSEESGMNVYCNPCWWSDAWDGLEYGMDFDPNKPFLEQWGELLRKVPMMPLFGLYPTLVNSDYTNMVSYIKNCYFITHSDYDENCAYGGFVTNAKECFDNFLIDQCELCYMSVNCRECYKTFFSLDCEGCQDVMFSRNCVGCSDCFGCVNLRKKKYHIFNKPYSKDEYEKKVKELYPSSHEKLEKLQEQLAEVWNAYPQKYMHESHNTKVTGDYIYNSKNTRDSHIVAEAEDCRFCAIVTPGGLKDSWDFTHYGPKSELLYESLQCGESKNMYVTWLGMRSSEVEYSAFIVSSQNIFGSVSLKNKKYCILNKQYSKEEYNKLREQIIAQMNEQPYIDDGKEYRYGEFFPSGICPFAYNETTAQFYFPLTKDVTEEKGMRWKEPEKKDYKITLPSEKLPGESSAIPESILDEIIECAHRGECDEGCATAFRVIPEEIQFYKKYTLPLPKLCPQCRYYSLVRQTNPLKLWHRQCMCDYEVYRNESKHQHHLEGRCLNEFETSYASDRKEIVYCEQCYQAEVM